MAQKWLDEEYTSGSRAAAFFAGCGLLLCQLAINVLDNAYSTGMDMAGLFSSYINIRRGAFIGLILSIAMCPWELLSSAAVFISVLSAYSVFLGPIIGIQVCDYWLVRRKVVKLSDLFEPTRSGSIYYFWHGVNPRSFIAWFLGFATQLPGFAATVTPDRVQVADPWHHLFSLAFPLGFAISFVLHYAINHFFPPPGLGQMDLVDDFGTFTPSEAAKIGIESVIEAKAAGFGKGEIGNPPFQTPAVPELSSLLDLLGLLFGRRHRLVSDALFDKVTGMVRPFPQIQILAVTLGVFQCLELGGNRSFAEPADFFRLFG